VVVVLLLGGPLPLAPSRSDVTRQLVVGVLMRTLEPHSIKWRKEKRKIEEREKCRIARKKAARKNG
jgi:hypothetical protein